jgi:hypothetical protein
MQLVASADESLYQKSLQTTMLEAKEEWKVGDDETLFFYPKVILSTFHCRLIASDLRMEIYVPD